MVEEIRKAGGVAMADGADVSNFEQVKAMVDRATREWGSVDLLCANAGILRDKSFAKMEIADFAKVLDVHLTGTFYCCKAVWDGMRERNYGRIVLTTSSSGLFGNFGQANYGAAKTGMVGLMNVLAEEGRKNNIRVNTISPTAATRMTEELLPPQALALMKPEAITPAVLYLLGEDAPTRTIMGAGAGSFAVIKIMETEGINLRPIRLDAGGGRRAFRRDQRHVEGEGAGRRVPADPEICRRRPRRGRASSCRARPSWWPQVSERVFARTRTMRFQDLSLRTQPGMAARPDEACMPAVSATVGLRVTAQNHVAIIGAGPAGLMAAEVLAQGGAGVTVYDAMPSAGRKFLMAGRGGLNLTHSEPLPAFLARYREAQPQLAAAHRGLPAGCACARGARRWGSRPSSAPAAGCSRKRSRPRRCCARGCGGWTRRACNSRCAIAGPAGMSDGRLLFQTPDGTVVVDAPRNRAGARRRQLAAARLRRGWAEIARGEGRGDLAAASRQLRLRRRLVRDLPRPLRGPAAEGRCAVVWRAHACAEKP